MLGYIYYIRNKNTNKYYIGQTIDYEQRKNKHLSALRKSNHHSSKLQSSYNLHGEEAFEWKYEIYQIANLDELYALEMKKIEEYNSYESGYNETRGGEGHYLVFSFHQACIIRELTNLYGGINRKVAKYFDCDHSVINNIQKNAIFKTDDDLTDEINKLIIALKLSEANKIENYIPHNLKKLNKTTCFEILSVVTLLEGYDRLIADIYKVDSKLIYRLKNNLIYKNYILEFNQLSLEDKKIIQKDVLVKYNLEHLRLERKRANIKNGLNQEQVDYIMDNRNLKKKVEIAKDLNISADRVSGVINGKSYKDLVENYFSRH